MTQPLGSVNPLPVGVCHVIALKLNKSCRENFSAKDHLYSLEECFRDIVGKLFILSMPGSPGLEAASDHHELEDVEQEADHEEGGPQQREGLAEHQSLLLLHPCLLLLHLASCEAGNGSRSQVGEGDEGWQEAAGDQEASEYAELCRVRLSAGCKGQESGRKGE